MCWKGLSYPPIRVQKVWYISSDSMIVKDGLLLTVVYSRARADERVAGGVSLRLQEGQHHVGAAGPGEVLFVM